MMAVNEDRAIGLVAGQAALNIGVSEMLTAGRMDAFSKVKGMSAEELAAIVRRALREEPVVTRLVPLQ